MSYLFKAAGVYITEQPRKEHIKMQQKF